jgi:AraC-like DNA-binding protein
MNSIKLCSEIFTVQMDPRIEYVASFIRENYYRKLTLTEMANTVNLSRWRLCHLFKEDMRTSPQRFLTQVRLEKARKLLATEFLTVKEVMNQVGIPDASSFARSFKAVYGVTPRQYRSAPKVPNSRRGIEKERRAEAG